MLEGLIGIYFLLLLLFILRYKRILLTGMRCTKRPTMDIYKFTYKRSDQKISRLNSHLRCFLPCHCMSSASFVCGQLLKLRVLSSRVDLKMSESIDRSMRIKFCDKIGKTAIETYQLMQVASTHATMKRTWITLWFPRFKERRTSIENDECSGLTSNIRHGEEIAQALDIECSVKWERADCSWNGWRGRNFL
jgi:hypothetical protein